MKNIVKSKKQTIIGNQKYINQDSGEIIDTIVIDKEVNSDFNFHKVFMTDLLEIMNNFGNKKIQIFSFLLSEMRNEDNSISVSNRYITKETGISHVTVTNTMKELKEMNIISYDKGKKVYYMNPDILVRGSSDKRHNMLIRYRQINKDSDLDNHLLEEKKILELENKGDL